MIYFFQSSNGFVTNELDINKIKDKLFPAVRKRASKAGNNYDKLEKILFIPASYDEDKQKAIESIRFWRGSMIKAFFDVDVHDPRKIEENGQVIGDDSLEKKLFIITNEEEGIKKLQKYRYLKNTKIVIMRISAEIAKAINDQISYEASSSHTYVAIGSWCERTGYNGSAAFFFEQAKEENTHMLKFIQYLNNAGAEAIIPAIEKPQDRFDSLESTFQAGLKSEQTVTKLIYNLVDMAEKEKDRGTYSFLQWFVSEQIEEETLFQTILQKFDILGRDKLAVYQIDQSLASIRSQIMTKTADQQQQPPTI